MSGPSHSLTVTYTGNSPRVNANVNVISPNGLNPLAMPFSPNSEPSVIDFLGDLQAIRIYDSLLTHMESGTKARHALRVAVREAARTAARGLGDQGASVA